MVKGKKRFVFGLQIEWFKISVFFPYVEE